MSFLRSKSVSDQAIQPLLCGRYELLGRLGEGGQGATSLAIDVHSGNKVVVKELHIELLEDWKAVELFEREAEILKSLDHGKIPAYIDAFHIADEAKGLSRLFLVQAHLPGEDLERGLERGSLLMNEARAKAFAREVLEILEYLHRLSPPVVHRDVKPSNILMAEDGSLALVDFGAAQAVLGDSIGGSTVIGTLGFIPPEQMIGRAVPASDLYGLGATLIRLLSKRHPAELPMERMRVKFRDAVQVSEGFARFIDKLIEPDVSKRFTNASEALRGLADTERLPSQQALKGSGLSPVRPRGEVERRILRPRDTKIAISRTRGRLTAALPTARLFRGSQGWTPPVGMAFFAWATYFFLVQLSIRGPILLLILLILIVGSLMALAPLFKRTTLILTYDQFRVAHELYGFGWGRNVATSLFVGLRTREVKAGNSTEERLVLDIDGRPVSFGGQLTSLERAWLVQEFGRGSQALLEESSG